MDRERLRKDIEIFGPWRAAWRRIGNAAERYLGIHWYVVMRRDTAKIFEGPVEIWPGLEFVDLDLTQALEAATNQPELELTPGFVEASFARGDLCRAAVSDGKVLGYVWLSTSGFTPHEDHVAMVYPPGSFYSGTAFVAPAARRRQLMVKLNRTNMILMAQRGYETEIGFTAVHNISTRGGRRFPWTLKHRDGSQSDDIGYAVYIRWGTLVRCFRSRAVRELGFGFVPTRSKAPPLGDPGVRGSDAAAAATEERRP